MYIGIDVGGTNIRVAGYEDLTTRNCTDYRSFLIENNYPKDYSVITDTVDQISSSRKINSIGIALPGTVNAECTHLTKCAKISSWENQHIGKQLAKRYGCKVYLQNDAMVSALGEYQFGHGCRLSPEQDFVYIVWGTGIGATHIRRVESKAIMSPIELGHTVVQRDGNQCRCGQRGCLQAYCSPLGVKDNHGERMEDLSDQRWEEVVSRFSQGIVNLSVLIKPSVIVFGSSVSLNHPDKVERIYEQVKPKLNVGATPEFRVSSLGSKAGTVGAIALINCSENNTIAF